MMTAAPQPCPRRVRWLLLAATLALPLGHELVARGMFGVTMSHGPVSATSTSVAPTWADAVWGVVAALAVTLGVWQLLSQRASTALCARTRGLLTLSHALTAAWLVAAAMLGASAALLLFAATAVQLRAAFRVADEGLAARRRGEERPPWVLRLPVTAFAAWLCMTSLLELMHLVVSLQLLPEQATLAYSVLLLAIATGALSMVNHRLGGSVTFVAMVTWMLSGIWVRQLAHGAVEAEILAWLALACAGVLAVLTFVQWRQAAGQVVRGRREGAPTNTPV